MTKKPQTSAVRRKYEFIKSHQYEHSVQMMCQLLDVATSGYYAWLKKPVSDRAREDKRLVRLIRASFKASQGVYGAPRVFLDLREAGETCSQASRSSADVREWHARQRRLPDPSLRCWW